MTPLATAPYTREKIEALRDVRYHRTPALCARSEEQALAFVDAVGFCFLFGDQSAEMPTLWAAVTGSRRPVPRTHFDQDVGHVWQWKDSLPARGALFYGKLLRDKPTLVSLALLPSFYALSPNYGDIDDYVEQYAEGKLTSEAKSVYEVLLSEGAMATSRLRQTAGLAGGGANARRFERALTELQRELKIVKVGTSDANAWGYAYVYDLFIRRFPEVPQRAHAISSQVAMETLLVRYLDNVVAQPEHACQRLFRWGAWEWERLVERLVQQGHVRKGLRVQGARGEWLAASADIC